MTVPAKYQPPRSIRVEYVHTIKCLYTFGGLELTFEGQTVNGIKAKAVIELHFCDIGHLADELWKCVRQRQERIDAIKNSLRGGQ